MYPVVARICPVSVQAINSQFSFNVYFAVVIVFPGLLVHAVLGSVSSVPK